MTTTLECDPAGVDPLPPAPPPFSSPTPARGRADAVLVRATIPYAREQVWRSWYHLVTTALILAGLMGAAAAPLAWWARLSAGLLAGLVLCRLFILYHDYQHKAILRGSRVAKAFMTLFGLLTLNPTSSWHRSHDYHHRHNAQLMAASHGSFPVMTTTAYAEATWQERMVYSIKRHPLTLLFSYITVFFYSMCVCPLMASPKRHRDCALAIVLHGSLIAVLAVFAPWVLLYAVLLPVFVSSAVGSYLFYVQHNFPEVDLRQRPQWSYVFAALHSSSYLDVGRMMHWFTGNIGYHHIHHLNARIPFYRLPEAMAEIEELQSPAKTSLDLVEIYRCLRLKLWSRERTCMVRASAA